MQSSEAIAARLDDLERKVERLRALYESFFLGIERRPPHVPRQELNRLMLETQQVSIRNAALRFRFQSLSQRWTLMTTYWNRTLREIESGTYRRDLQKAYRRLAARGEPLTEDEAATLGIPAGRAKAFVAQQNRRWGSAPEASPSTVGGDASPRINAADRTATAGGDAPPRIDATDPAATAADDAARSSTPAVPRNAGARNPASGSSGAIPSADNVDLVAIHRAYADAHVRLALPGPPPSEDRVRAQVVPYLERLRAAHPGARLTVAVVEENGRAVIRAKRVRQA